MGRAPVCREFLGFTLSFMLPLVNKSNHRGAKSSGVFVNAQIQLYDKMLFIDSTK